MLALHTAIAVVAAFGFGVAVANDEGGYASIFGIVLLLCLLAMML